MEPTRSPLVQTRRERLHAHHRSRRDRCVRHCRPDPSGRIDCDGGSPGTDRDDGHIPTCRAAPSLDQGGAIHRVHDHGRSDLLGGVHDRGLAPGSEWTPRAADGNPADRAGHHLLVDVNYWQLVARFPIGGGSAEASARAFGTGWVFVPIGALIVDFVLTITISVAAAVSALVSYVPSLASLAIVLGLRSLASWLGLRGSATAAG